MTTLQSAPTLPSTSTAGAAASKTAPWLLLFGRAFLFLAVQALFALGYLLAGSAQPWEAGAAWWPLGVTVVNLICLAALVALYRREGRRYWDNFRIRREHVRSDLLALAGPMLALGPVSYLPNLLLATWLFGSLEAVLPLMVRPLPLWAAWASVFAFPVTQGLVELAVYFVYAMPRLFGADPEARPAWKAAGLASLMLGLQHAAIPFLFDARYLTWRALMFIPFAAMAGLILRWRPRLLPYLAVIHVLMDMAFAAMLLPAAY